MDREQVIALAQQAGLTLGYPFTWDTLARFAALVAAAEREACAKLVEGYGVWEHNHVLAAAIRQRGQA